MRELENQLSQCKNQDATWWVTNVLSKYQDKVSLTDAEHVLDYFNAYPTKKLKRMSIKDALRLSKEWTQRLEKKGKGIVETEQDVKVFIQFPNGMRFVKLVSKASYLREGNLMSHCVGGYHNSSDSDIYSLRDSNNNPHCTIEVTKDNRNIQQVKGRGNGSIHPKYIKYVLKFFEKVNIPIRGSEMKNLGYVKWTPHTWSLIDVHFKGVKEVTYDGTRYFYKHSKIQRKE